MVTRLAISEVSTESIAEVSAFTRDPEDDVYVLTATLVDASYLVSWDGNILGIDDPPVTVLNPAQFVRLWQARLF
jgi:predicted nucleic acid-binding protein